MSLGLCFWILYLICVVFSVFTTWPADRNFRAFGGNIMFFVLIGLLGWQVFGAPLHR